MNNDAHLLRQFSRDGSEQAFRELVQRYIPLVNATARRMTAGDAHLAQDITQVVFTNLARKAATFPDDVLLGGWLHRHTCFTASKTIRAERRRRARENTAMEMNALHDSPSNDAQWAQLAPVLDDALNSLSAADREAILLRHFQRLDLRAIGLALGTSDDTAQKRITRALEKLRGILTRRGLTLSAALLATTLNASAAPPVPATLAVSVSAHAITHAAAATGFTLASLYTMLTSKLALSVTAVLALTGVATVLIAQNDAHDQTSTVLTSPQNKQPPAAPTPDTTKPDALESRVFDMPVLTFAYMTGFAGASSSRTDGENIKNALIQFGVTFPDGSSLLYNPVLHKIAVTNTADNLLMVDKVLNKFSEPDTAPSNPFSTGSTLSASQNAQLPQGAGKLDAFDFHVYAMDQIFRTVVLASNAKSPATQQPSNEEIKNALINLGVGFPPSSGLLYNVETAKIAVFNTPSNQAKIAAILSPNPFASANSNPATPKDDTFAPKATTTNTSTYTGAKTLTLFTKGSSNVINNGSNSIISDAITGSSHPATENRDTGAFSSIQVDGSASVDVTIGSTTAVTLTTDDNILPVIETKVSGDELHISSSKSYTTRIGLKVKITTPTLNGVAVNGSGDFHAIGLDTGTFSLAIMGSSSASLSGKAQTFEVNLSGSGSIQAHELIAKNVDLVISGTGSANVYATDSLDATVSGTGNVRYSGNPAQVHQNVSGTGSIKSDSSTAGFQQATVPIGAGRGNLTFGPPPSPSAVIAQPIRNDQSLTDKYLNQPGSASLAAGVKMAPSPNGKVIAPKDVLTVILDGSSRVVTVDGDGMLKLPDLKNPLRVAGLTTDVAAQILNTAYKDEGVNPDAKAVVGILPPLQHVNVIGQVGRPGQVNILPDHPLTLIEAVASAGGHTRIAAHKVTITRHDPDGNATNITANLYDAMNGDLKANVILRSGDTVYVDESNTGW